MVGLPGDNVPAIVVVSVDVQDLLALDTQHSVGQHPKSVSSFFLPEGLAPGWRS